MKTNQLIKIFSPDIEAGTVARKTYSTPTGYLFCIYKQKTFYVHRIIYQAANGPIPKNKEINHIDLDKKNNKLSNLELVTHKQNMKHAVEKLGTLRPKVFTEEQQKEKARQRTREWEASLNEEERAKYKEKQRQCSLRWYHKNKNKLKRKRDMKNAI
jgi:hypothetical protein